MAAEVWCAVPQKSARLVQQRWYGAGIPRVAATPVGWLPAVADNVNIPRKCCNHCLAAGSGAATAIALLYSECLMHVEWTCLCLPSEISLPSMETAAAGAECRC